MARISSRLTPDYVWDDVAARYVDTVTGRYASRSAVRGALDDYIAARGVDVEMLAAQLQRGDITLAAWQLGMEQAIADVNLASAAAARGGWAQMSQADYGRVGQTVREQYAFLRDFAAQIQSGQIPLDGRFLNRAGMYADAGRNMYYRQWRAQMRARGVDEERSIRFSGDSCEGCIEAEAMGWTPIGTLPLPGARDCLCVTTPHSRVSTARGLIPIADVRIGDYVWTHRMRWRMVTGTSINPPQPHHRQAWIKSPTGEWIGCTADHKWLTPHGWREASVIGELQLPMYTYRHEPILQKVRGMAALRFPLRISQKVRAGLFLRQLQRLSRGAVHGLRDEGESIGAVGQFRSAPANGRRDGRKRPPSPPEIRRLDIGFFLVPQGRGRALLQLLLGRKREEMFSLSLPVGLAASAWPNSCGESCPSPKRELHRRQIGKPRTFDTCSAWRSAHDRREDASNSGDAGPCFNWRAALDLSFLRQRLSNVCTRGSAAQILLEEMPLCQESRLYDISVEEDCSFVIEGLIAHNSNCRCEMGFRIAATGQVFEE